MSKNLGLAISALMCLSAAACTDSDTDTDTTADRGTPVVTYTKPTGESCVSESHYDRSGSLVLDNVLEVNGFTTTAHSNCGHMTYCNQGGYAIYCYYNQNTTGCTNQDIVNDYNGDCQTVCGHTACLYSKVGPC